VPYDGDVNTKEIALCIKLYIVL